MRTERNKNGIETRAGGGLDGNGSAIAWWSAQAMLTVLSVGVKLYIPTGEKPYIKKLNSHADATFFILFILYIHFLFCHIFLTVKFHALYFSLSLQRCIHLPRKVFLSPVCC